MHFFALIRTGVREHCVWIGKQSLMRLDLFGMLLASPTAATAKESGIQMEYVIHDQVEEGVQAAFW